MTEFSYSDILIIVSFFAVVIGVGFYAGRKRSYNDDDYLLSGRKVGLVLFVFTNVATWYGGILGVGEFTYRYGILSWVTRGLPYYIFAILFAFFFAEKIRSASLFTIPEKLEAAYGRKVGLFSAVLIFILVSPAPYLLMIGSLIALVFNVSIIWGLLAGIVASTVYLFKGGYRSNIFTDAFQFFIMFAGFGAIVFFSLDKFDGFDFISRNLPSSYLTFDGGASPVFILVWFLIALWTFTDPGFHQRCYSAKDGKTAKYGIIISVFFWALFDFLTTATGLFSRAALPKLGNPVLSFPLFAEAILPSGLKGLFFAALFATILSTLNSFMFLSATTVSRDFLIKFSNQKDSIKLTRIGIIATALISFIFALFFDSVIDMWYVIGSFCIPGLILPVIGAYYPKLRISGKIVLLEMSAALSVSIAWFIARPYISAQSLLAEIEPMIFGLFVAFFIHFAEVLKKSYLK